MVIAFGLLVAAAPMAAIVATTPSQDGPVGAADNRAPITSRDLVESAEITGPSLSPDGRRIAFRVSRASIERNETSLDWFVVPVGGGTALPIGGGGIAQHDGAGGLIEPRPVWDRDSRGLRFLSFDGDRVSIWHWREGSKAVREIVDDADIIDFMISPDGSALRYTTGASRSVIAAAERREYDDGVLVDHRLDLMQPLAGGVIEGGARIMQRLPTAWFERERILFDVPRKETVVPVGHSARDDRSAPPPQFPARPTEQGMKIDGPRGSAEIVGDGADRRVVVTRGDGRRVPCIARVCTSPDLVALAWRPGHDMLLLFERAGSARETIWLWRPGNKTARRLSVTDGVLRAGYRAPRCVPAFSALVCATAGPTSPPQLVSLPYAGGAAITLADPNRAIRDRIKARAAPLSWKNGATGILLLPPGKPSRLPVVVQYYHCAGFLKGGVGEEIPMLPLIESGIAILCMDRVRVAADGGMEASYDRALADIGRAIDELAADGTIDPGRVGIGGLSFGSEVALWSIRKSKRFAAATLSSGQLSAIYYWANALPGRGFAEMLGDFWKVGDPDTDPERWKLLAPTADAGAIDTPLLMQLPESEVRYAVEFHTKLKRAGKPAEMVAFADEPHIKYQPKHKRAVYERNLDWYRFWLKGETDPDPAKAGQYVRWERLRAGQSLPEPAQ